MISYFQLKHHGERRGRVVMSQNFSENANHNPTGKPSQLTKPQFRLKQFSSKLFKACEKRVAHIQFLDELQNFLIFSSYALNDPSLYPYWCDYAITTKNTYISRCASYRKTHNGRIKTLILENKNDFWSYMSEILSLRKTLFNSEDLRVDTYIYEFINNILVFDARKSKDSYEFGQIENLVHNANLINCEQFFNYIDKLFDIIKSSFPGSSPNANLLIDWHATRLGKLSEHKKYIKRVLKDNIAKILKKFGKE